MNSVNLKSLLILTLVASGSLSAITPETDATVINNALLAMNNESADDSLIDPNDLLRMHYPTKLKALNEYIKKARGIEQRLTVIPSRSPWWSEVTRFEDEITDIRIELLKLVKQEPLKNLMHVVETELDDALVDQLVNAIKTLVNILEKCDEHFRRIPQGSVLMASSKAHFYGFYEFRTKIEVLRTSGFEGYLQRLKLAISETKTAREALTDDEIDADRAQEACPKLDEYYKVQRGGLLILTNLKIVRGMLNKLTKQATPTNLDYILDNAKELKAELAEANSLIPAYWQAYDSLFEDCANVLYIKAKICDVELDTDDLRPWHIGKVVKLFSCCKAKQR